jgi:hypothetical protein
MFVVMGVENGTGILQQAAARTAQRGEGRYDDYKK